VPLTVRVKAPLPAETLAGLMAVMTGTGLGTAAVTVKTPEEVAVPPAVVTVIGPVMAPAGTITPVRVVPDALATKSLLTVLLLGPLKLTTLVLLRLLP
jgi:hypothetical protein